MKELFIKFLKKHGALRTFKYNLRYVRLLSITIEEYCKDNNFGDISGAFTWSNSTEGHEYWKNLDKLWEEYKVKDAERTK